jgi:hypothetical protein
MSGLLRSLVLAMSLVPCLAAHAQTKGDAATPDYPVPQVALDLYLSVETRPGGKELLQCARWDSPALKNAGTPAAILFGVRFSRRYQMDITYFRPDGTRLGMNIWDDTGGGRKEVGGELECRRAKSPEEGRK